MFVLNEVQWGRFEYCQSFKSLKVLLFDPQSVDQLGFYWFFAQRQRLILEN